jgi:nicotinamide mononucleotide transporter
MSILEWLFEAQIQFGSKSITYREIIGGLLGLTSAVLGLKRKVLAWPVMKRLFTAKPDVICF